MIIDIFFKQEVRDKGTDSEERDFKLPIDEGIVPVRLVP